MRDSPIRTIHVVTLIYLSMLSSTLVIPAVRPFIADVHGGGQAAMNAFMGLNMLGAFVGAPVLSLLGDRGGRRRRLAVALCAADGVLLFACSLPLPLGWVLAARCLEGAANVGALSVLMGFAAANGETRGHGRAMGVAGASVMAAVATGSPLGTMLMTHGDAVATLRGGALVAALAAAGCGMLPAAGVAAAPRVRLSSVVRKYTTLRWPTLWVAAERFTVGCFVVTFALHAHDVLALGDTQTGTLYSWFLLPFALATYPMGRLADHMSRRQLVAAAGLTYAATFFAFGSTPANLLPAVLFLAGVSSATLYACSLCYATSLVPPALRATSMGLLNAGGSIGMFAGTACAGVLLGVLPRMGLAPATTYDHVFWAAGTIQGLVICAWLVASAVASRRACNTNARMAWPTLSGSPPKP